MFARPNMPKPPGVGMDFVWPWLLPALVAGANQPALQNLFNTDGVFTCWGWKWRYPSGQEMSLITNLVMPDGQQRIGGNIPICTVGALSSANDGEQPKPFRFTIENGQSLSMGFTPIAGGAAGTVVIMFYGWHRYKLPAPTRG